MTDQWWILILVLLSGHTVVVPGRYETQVDCTEASKYATARRKYIEAVCIPVDERWLSPFLSPFLSPKDEEQDG